MNLAAFIDNKRKCDRDSDGKYLGDLPVGVIRFICGFCENVIRRYLRTAVRLGKPTEELRALARRLCGKNEFFSIGLFRRLCVSISEIPRQCIAVGRVLGVEGFACGNGHSVV